MTKDEMERLKGLEEKADPGPWKFMAKHVDSDPDAHVRRWSDGYEEIENDDGTERVTDWCYNLAYIAAANPTAILALIARVEEMEKEREDMLLVPVFDDRCAECRSLDISCDHPDLSGDEEDAPPTTKEGTR